MQMTAAAGALLRLLGDEAHTILRLSAEQEEGSACQDQRPISTCTEYVDERFYLVTCLFQGLSSNLVSCLLLELLVAQDLMRLYALLPSYSLRFVIHSQSHQAISRRPIALPPRARGTRA
jgi:hypothetical protein